MPSYEEISAIFDKVDKEIKERHEQEEREWQKEIERRRTNGEKIIGPSSGPAPKQRCDHPNTPEDSTATIMWIVAMVISLLFKGGWVLCIVETIIWFKFISRYW